jgi:Double zinc ribbon
MIQERKRTAGDALCSCPGHQRSGMSQRLAREMVMEQCAFCQATLDAETRFCWQCGRARTSMLLSEATAPSLAIVMPARRCVVCGEALPRGANTCGYCFSVQPASGALAPGGETSPSAPQKRCAACSEESPIWARFCGACRQPFALPVDDPGELTQQGTLTEAPVVAGASAHRPRVTHRLPSGLLIDMPESFPEASNAPTEAHAPVAPGLGTDPWLRTGATPTLEQVAQPAPRVKLGKLQIRIIAAVLVTALVVTAGGATLAYFLTRPAPVIQVTSASLVGKTPAGSPTTILHVSGQHFSHYSSVTLLLDKKPAPAAPSVPTDAAGSFHVDLMVTEAWHFGLHTLMATDARGYTTMQGALVDIIPRPVITVLSHYQQHGVSAGATTTSLHVTGKWFSYHSAITFLLDGHPAPGSQGAESDAQGNVIADLTVTDDWGLGDHVLTAKDAQGYATQSGRPLSIVPQGEAGTPGPNGAPADDASFTLSVTVQTTAPITGAAQSMQETLAITGQADPAGGTVCQARDNGQPFTQTGTVLDTSGMPTGVTYQETLTATCSGSYKGGQLSYTETATSDQYVLSNGLTCQASAPYTLQSLSGSFSDATTSSGSWSAAGPAITCSQPFPFTPFPTQQGSWSGAIH